MESALFPNVLGSLVALAVQISAKCTTASPSPVPPCRQRSLIPNEDGGTMAAIPAVRKC